MNRRLHIFVYACHVIGLTTALVAWGFLMWGFVHDWTGNAIENTAAVMLVATAVGALTSVVLELTEDA